jgi:hypothetical protein
MDKEKSIKWVFCFICASLFHLSAVITVPIVLISTIKINNVVRMIMLIAILMIIYMVVDMNFIFDIAGLVSARYASYAKHASFGKQTQLETGLGVIVNLILPVIILLNSKNIRRMKKGDFVLNMNCIYIAAYSFALQIDIFTRIRESLIYIPLFSIGFLLDSNKKYAKVLYGFLFVVYIAFYIKSISISTVGSISSGILPYRSIFNK